MNEGERIAVAQADIVRLQSDVADLKEGQDLQSRALIGGIADDGTPVKGVALEVYEMREKIEATGKAVDELGARIGGVDDRLAEGAKTMKDHGEKIDTAYQFVADIRKAALLLAKRGCYALGAVVGGELLRLASVWWWEPLASWLTHGLTQIAAAAGMGH